ncbi:hypothetical protein MGYG_09167 [Nannizzia gypsea CBS 118893]|uniref:AAA+ ATPase domain-containing protein n=1 Tax=Arthroderma gypseum (strain ATCC MYA-4604 / CBS 118893) TaxID=535722 RepID=E4V3Y6_ARTGP|nr:hypothetical protein MGYG_09167 [Nannizzia gypsea CBS 118893]EFR04710.1 hypothetical protein MGYG_09167 [Nannizzia gypsea CBS 118893]
MARRAVEQQTLLPFFSKRTVSSRVSARIWLTLLLDESIAPPIQPEPLRPQPSQHGGNQAINTPDGGQTPEHTSERNIYGNSQSDGDTAAQDVFQPFELNHLDDVEEEAGHRRKRCKTAEYGTMTMNPVVLNAVPEIEPQVTSFASSVHPVSEMPVTYYDASSTPTGSKLDEKSPVASDKKSQPERRLLHLRLDSKLLSAFPLGESVGYKQPRQSTRRKSSRLNTVAKFVNRVKIAKIAYNPSGPFKQNIGQLIDDIMNGRTTYSELKRRTTQSKTEPRTRPSSTGPPKPTHPFFLSKSQQKTSNQPLQPSNTPSNALGNSTLPQASIQLQNKSSTSTSRIFPPLSFPSTSQKQKVREPLNPIWPPRDMVHTRGPIDPVYPSTGRRLEKRKAKQSAVSVSDTESILSTITLSLAGSNSTAPKQQRSKALRRPKRHVLKCSEFKRAVIEKLAACNFGQGGQSQLDTLPQTTHPALVKLASSLNTATSPFDRGEYDDTTWPQKYAPKTAAEVLLLGPETSILRSWLQNHQVSAVDTGLGTSPRQTPENKAVRKRKRKKPKDLDGFIVSSEDEDGVMSELQNSEDELAGCVTVPVKRSIVRSNDLGTTSAKRPMANTILLSGPPGCGKTAAVYAVAGELGFEVFEINAGTRRGARDIVERVGDMTQNHLVQLLAKTDGESEQVSSDALDNGKGSKQSTMASFFAKKSVPKSVDAGSMKKMPKTESSELSKPQINQKQSLILLEEVDVLFNEDKQFWTGVLALISQSKRPIVMTCTDESLLPLDNLVLHAVLRFQPPPNDLAVDYILLLCANEGHLLDRKAVSDLYIALGRDLRATITRLSFWCQMGVGSRKSGLDWMVATEALDLRDSGELYRTISSDTYMECMGWYSADTVVTEQTHLELRQQLLNEGNIICDEGYHGNKRSLDPSMPPIPEKQRLDYIEGYQLLQSDPRMEFNQLSAKIGAALSTLTETALCPAEVCIGEQDDVLEHVLERAAPKGPKQLHKTVFQDAFQAIIDPPDYSILASSIRPLSFEHGTSVIAEDVAPYIRHIVLFDMYLEQYRLRLNGLFPQNGPSSKRARTTRASRAAVEGVGKADIRRERWFPGRVIPELIMATGGKGWENILQYPITNDLAEIHAVFSQAGQPLCHAPAAPCENGAQTAASFEL